MGNAVGFVGPPMQGKVAMLKLSPRPAAEVG